ncbi:hypothetical protein M231_05459 [Tremella mesenterica]|uniref:Uncharacterized protein n=1 Tax=Tremella mesenterica TaxID=5217 RepID=A0A4V1M3L8_TREME|nr:hypothetical protein M231_05459 [Tremella mesenterica]
MDSFTALHQLGFFNFPYPLNSDDFEAVPGDAPSLVLTNTGCHSKRHCDEQREHRDFFMRTRGDENMYRLTKLFQENGSHFECRALGLTDVTTVTEFYGNQVKITSGAFNEYLGNDPGPSGQSQGNNSALWTFRGEDFVINDDSRIAKHNWSASLEPHLMAPGLYQALSILTGKQYLQEITIIMQGWMTKDGLSSAYSAVQYGRHSKQTDLTQVTEIVILSVL